MSGALPSARNGVSCHPSLGFGDETFFRVTEAGSCQGNFTLECFPCIVWNAYNKRYFAIPPATPASGPCTFHLHDGSETFSLPIPVKHLEIQPNFSKILPTEVFLLSFATTGMQCLDSLQLEEEVDPSLQTIEF